MAVLSFGMYGCRKEEPEKKIENTTTIVIGYDINSHIAIITDKEQIKQLEELFNGAELTKSDKEIQLPYLSISFSGEKSSTSFFIDENDVIKEGDGNYLQSKQISFEALYSIFKEDIKKKK